MNRTITFNSIEPAPLSIRHPLGIRLDLNVKVLAQGGTPYNVAGILPQFVLLPRSRGGVRPYDMDIIDSVNGDIRVQIPGYDIADEHGYSIELYSRMANPNPTDPPLPTGLLATGALVTQGSAHASDGPLSIINVPTVTGPPGPAGPQGAPSTVPGPTGQRGSVWTTGVGDPVALGPELPGDMYLNEANGDVWRYDGAVWTRGTF